MNSKVDKASLNDNLILLQQGNESAFDRVYEMTNRSVYMLILSILKDKYKSEDIMQDTYIKIRKNISQYKPNTNSLAWVLTIAKSLAINEYNRAKRDLVTDFTLPTMEKPYSEAGFNRIDDRQILEQAFKVLSDRECGIVFLHAVKGVKHKDIAKVYDITLSNTLWIYHNSMKKLKVALEGELNE